MSITEFIEEFKQFFPELEQEIEGYEGNVNAHAGKIKDAINQAGADGTIDFVAEVLALLGDMIKYADEELKNFIAVSVLEHLDIDRESLERMPEMLRELYNEIQGYRQEQD